jgi:TonB family protein
MSIPLESAAILWRVTAIWVAAAVAAAAFRSRTSAAQRHFVWLLAQSGPLVILLVFFLLPSWRGAPAAAPGQPAKLESAIAVSASAPVATGSPRNLGLSWIWLGGAMLVFVWTTAGLIRVQRISRRSVRLGSPVLVTVRTEVPILSNDRVRSPFTWGLFRPEIVLPAEAIHWEAARLRAAVLHELAHVRRRDWTVLILSRIVCAIFWFHPLAWLAARELRRLSEYACDDSVLNEGVNPMLYTQQLVDLARTARAPFSAAVSMANASRLEARVKALLNPRAKRGPIPGVAAGLTSILALALLIAVSPARSVAQTGRTLVAGVARDASGAAVPGVAVTLANAQRKEIVTTGDAGEYQFAGLPPGAYRLEARKPGFKVLDRTVNVLPNQTTQLPLDLLLGEVSETIRVTAKAPPPVPSPGVVPRRIRVGGSVQATRLTFKSDPVYPEDARQRGIEGTVLLNAVIGTDGRLAAVTPLNALVDPALTRSAVDAVSQWRYEPTLLNGEPVQVVTNITVDFKLEH